MAGPVPVNYKGEAMKLSEHELVIISYALGDLWSNDGWVERVRDEAEALYERVNTELAKKGSEADEN